MDREYKKPLMIKIKIFLFFIYLLLFYMYGANPEKIKYSEIILLIFLGLESIKVIKTKKIKFCIPIVISFAFAFYCFLSSLWAINPEMSIEKAKTLFVLSSFLLVGYNFFIEIDNSEDILLKIIMYAGIAFSIYVIMYYGISNYFNKLMHGERIGTEINNVNSIGLQTAIAVIIAIFYGLYNKKMYYICAILPLIVALATGSRKVIIMILLGIILLLLLKNNEKHNIKIILKKIFIFLFVIFILFEITKIQMFSTGFERLENMIQIMQGNGKSDGSTDLRIKYIKIGMKQFYEKPILGIGIANSGYITSKYTKNFTYLHNNYVELLACAGIIGFLLYYSMYFYIIYYCIKNLKQKSKYINILLAIFLINLILEYGVVSYSSKSTYIYIMLGIITIERRKKINEQN